MAIDWVHFTPWTSLAGGILLGIAASLFILVSGRVLGISSLLGDLLFAKRSDMGWRIAFLGGLMVAPYCYLLLAPTVFVHVPRFDGAWGTMVLAGVLVGVGTRCGSGCTSGHGVCGLARLSPRSMVATGIFMLVGFIVVFLVRHVLGGGS